MNPPESFPLQGGNVYHPNTGQPSSMVQYTTVNINREMPKDYLIWSLCCLLYANPFCLGLAALIDSVKARDRKVVGDIEGARTYGSRARTLNIIATVIVCLSVLIFIIVLAVVLSQTTQARYSSYQPNNYNNHYYSG